MRLIFLLPLLIFTNALFAQELRINQITPEIALKRLMNGNERFAQEKAIHPIDSSFRREATVEKQRPFAVILGCADSRTPPEIIFDQGLGDLFVIRVAGNVLDPLVLDSIEYSIIYNKSSLVMVLGHENCGAVSAVLENNVKDIPTVASLIEPNIRSTKSVEDAVKANVVATANKLKNSPVLAKFIETGKVGVVGAYYSLRTGKVDLVRLHEKAELQMR